MKLSPEELTAMTIYQVGALKGFLDAERAKMNHVKPHGVLYGMMCRDIEVARAVMKGVPKGVPVFGLAGTKMEEAAKEEGVEFCAEMYVSNLRCLDLPNQAMRKFQMPEEGTLANINSLSRGTSSIVLMGCW